MLDKRYCMYLLRISCFGAGVFLGSCLGFVPSEVRAQEDDKNSLATPAALKERQDALFNALYEDPQNLELLFAYAEVSMRRADYEPAISALERMLLINPDLPRVKLELGAAYFRIGAYAVAKRYFNQARAANPPAEVVARIDAYMAEIDKRNAKSSYTGFVSVGGVWSSNANLGPDDRQVLLALSPSGYAELDGDSTSKNDVGLKISGGLTHSYDMGGQNGERWISDLAYFGLHYSDETSGDTDAFFLRSGPELALDDEAYGLKMRPFVDFGYVASGNDYLFTAYGGGVRFSDTFGPTTALDAEVRINYRDYDNLYNDSDGVYGTARVRVLERVLDNLDVSGALVFHRDDADAGYSSSTAGGIRGGLSYRMAMDAPPPELDASQAYFRRDWNFFLTGEVLYRKYDDPDPIVDPDRKRDSWDFRIVAGASIPLDEDWQIEPVASWFHRDSNIRNYDLENFELGAALTRRF